MAPSTREIALALLPHWSAWQPCCSSSAGPQPHNSPSPQNNVVTEQSAPVPSIAAVIAAAGRSTRMGAPKQLLPWQATTVLGAVIEHLRQAGAGPLVVVVGHEAAAVRAALADAPVQIVANPDYSTGEMLSSHQAGLRRLLSQAHEGDELSGALLALGDQPHIPADVIRQVIEQARRTPDALVIPSYAIAAAIPSICPPACGKRRWRWTPRTACARSSRATRRRSAMSRWIRPPSSAISTRRRTTPRSSPSRRAHFRDTKHASEQASSLTSAPLFPPRRRCRGLSVLIPSLCAFVSP